MIIHITHIYLLTGPQELVSPTSVGQHQEPAGAAGVVRQWHIRLGPEPAQGYQGGVDSGHHEGNLPHQTEMFEMGAEREMK